MIIQHDVPLAPLTTLGVGGPARRFVRMTSDQELTELLDASSAGAADDDVLVLGGGSNLVIGDAGFAGLVVQIAMTGVSIEVRDNRELAVARAGTPWDDFVAEMVESKLAGVECLSGIPGLVGATPMQNVGAYGQEVSETIGQVRAFDHDAGRDVLIGNADCAFGYRTSKFRGSTRWIVRDVAFGLERSELSKPIRYAELARALGVHEGERAPLSRVREVVIELRRGKGMVIDPTDPESRSAGSFFTNPIVTAQVAASLPSNAPRWPQPGGLVKLAAAWLIEHAGFAKGHTAGRVGISRKHALALVNRGGATAEELLALARSIQDAVRAKFAIELQPEPIIV